MSQTVIGVGDPRAIRRWSSRLAQDTLPKSFWGRKFFGKDENSVIHETTELASGAGDRIQFDLSANITGSPVLGDDTATGKEKALRFYSDEVAIDQARLPVSAGGRMTQKRTVHNLRNTARRRMAEYWASWIDQLVFMYLAGARGVNTEFHEPTTYAGHAGNNFTAYDNAHLLYGGSATSKATITNSDKMSRDLIERAETNARMMKARDNDASMVLPVNIGGEERYAVVMSSWQEHDLRNSDTQGWVQIQRDATAAQGQKNPLFTGMLGMVKGVVLHSHQYLVRFSDYGAGGNLPAARALFLGRQAACVAYGTSRGMRYEWQEELRDFKNQLAISSGLMFGMKRTIFNDRTFGAQALDTYCADPNA
ncbi:N4-gp56 family major capsid protein [Rhodobacter sp. NTK016B]|uniref:N4-gp56 family major capsid protein n=1 Tax=Rhodobacter sp. NTK016B TaxID=2759676 RepID=UPI001A8F6F4F|nr:N4-gp56 family major capsid protein [Rhodobacter sp. NTK016B]MBN8294554.1 N4-gp56 family major capsid protein [Rhodobacter sp. NTK016B]